MNDPFLIDECSTLDLVAVAHARGHYASHISYRGLHGPEDLSLLPLAHAETFVFVTNNARDFLRSYRRQWLHPGLVILVPGSIGRLSQIRLFSLVLNHIEPVADLTDKLVEVTIDGTVSMRDWPPA